ncbi:MAG TPA: alpha-mannosidase [Candidatus Bathyarchaeota archaeon]|nr:alpha-mannosidase [Candidatus Bathyarchaeota archaeon]
MLKQIYLIGNAHIDPIWLWDWNEGLGEVVKTFSDMASLLEETKGVYFTQGQMIFYLWVERSRPSLIKRIRKLVRKGRWEPVGGWIVEPDCNIPSGESFVRHILYGQRIAKRLFGKYCNVSFNPDSFGHNASLPQLLSKGGFKYYVFMRPHPHEKNTPQFFMWRSPDGSQIKTYRIPYSYCRSGENLLKLIHDSIMELSSLSPLILFYGQGDHGGGPNLYDLEIIKRFDGYKGYKLQPNTLERALEELFNSAQNIPTLDGELQPHAVGCYSVVHHIKELNRKAEETLLSLERILTICYFMKDYKKYPKKLLEDLWIHLLSNQFHDILGGSSIHEAYEKYVFPTLNGIISRAEEELYLAVRRIEEDITTETDGIPLIVWNLNTSEVIQPVTIDFENYRERDGRVLKSPLKAKLMAPGGEEIPYIYLEKSDATSLNRFRIHFLADLPPLGYRVYTLVDGESPHQKPAITPGKKISNNNVSVEVDGNGVQIYWKNTPLFRDRGLKLQVINDRSDTWSHGIYKYPWEGELFRVNNVETVENQCYKALRIFLSYRNSEAEMEYRLYNGTEHIDVSLTVNWREKWKILKLIFPIDIDPQKLRVEVPYSHIDRSDIRIESPMQRWIAVEGRKGGLPLTLVIVNNTTYAYDYNGETLRLTLLRSPPYAYHEPYMIKDEKKVIFTDQGVHNYRFLLKICEGDLDPGEACRLAEALNNPPYGYSINKKKGIIGLEGSFINIKGDLLIRAIKLSEDGNDAILRVYNPYTETKSAEVTFLQHKIHVRASPLEIKTLKVSRDGDVKEVNLLEEA